MYVQHTQATSTKLRNMPGVCQGQGFSDLCNAFIYNPFFAHQVPSKAFSELHGIDTASMF